MQFFVERALDESLSSWEKIGFTEVTGIAADAYAVEHLAAYTGIYRVRPAASPDQLPVLFSVDARGQATRRATV